MFDPSPPVPGLTGDGPRSAVRKATTAATVRVIGGGTTRVRHDRVATEEPMEIRVGGPGQEASSVAVTMRTPGHDFELAVGFLWAEGIVTGPGDVRAVKYCELDPGAEQQYNIVTVRIGHRVPPEASRRSTLTTASCGLCGTTSLDRLGIAVRPLAINDGLRIAGDVLIGLPDSLRAGQATFDRTGGLHGAALFSADGTVTAVREDVGRHNAVDKVLGRALLDRSGPLHDRVLVVSGRTSFEIVQKAAVAGVAIVAAVSAPSSLAVEAAERFGITLVGFVRDGRANVYTHAERVVGY